MFVKAVKTRPFMPPRDDLFALFQESFLNLDLKERSVVVVASKVVAIWQGRCVKMEPKVNKDDLIKEEADFYLDRSMVPNGYVVLTIKDNILIPTAGIDESNGNGYFILWPEHPFDSAKQIHNFVQENYHLSDLGVIIADSHCTPSRRGTTGISIGYCGFYPVNDYRGTKDIFGREMKITLSNLADSLAASAVLVMGEGDEQTPIALIEDVDFVKFEKFDPTISNPLSIEQDDDIYAPFLKAVRWQKGRGRC